jgi:hypothetical protein
VATKKKIRRSFVHAKLHGEEGRIALSPNPSFLDKKIQRGTVGKKKILNLTKQELRTTLMYFDLLSCIKYLKKGRTA